MTEKTVEALALLFKTIEQSQGEMLKRALLTMLDEYMNGEANAAAAHVAASRLRSVGRKKIPPGKVNQLILKEFAGLAHLEDPIETPFVEELVYIGGSFKLIPGAVAQATFTLRLLLRALEVAHGRGLKPATYIRASRLCGAGLIASDFILGRACLGRRSSGAINGTESSPCSASELRRLATAARVRVDELDRVLTEKGLSADDIRPLVAKDVELDRYTLDDGCLLRSPFVEHGDEFILAIPSAIVSALRYHVLEKLDGDDREVLSNAFADCTWDSIEESLRLLGMQKLDAGLPRGEASFLERAGFFRFDFDKVLFAYLACDDLALHTGDDVFPSVAFHDIEARIHATAKLAREFIANLQPPSEYLFLALPQIAGGDGVFGLEELPDADAFLALPPAELDTIAFLEPGESQLLRQFALARTRIRETCTVHPTSTLNEFAFFREHGYSYYTSDESRPSHLWIAPGFSGDLNREVARRRGFHGATSPDGSGLRRVALKYESDDFPLYFPLNFGGPAALLLEGDPNVWVISEIERPGMVDYCEFVAYWLWQLRPAIKTHLSWLAEGRGHVLIRLNLDGELPLPEAESSAEDFLAVSLDPESRAVVLRFDLEHAGVLLGPDNAGERETLVVMLTSLDEAIGAVSSHTPTLNAVQVVDDIAPLGQKKKLLMLPPQPEFDDSGLPWPPDVSAFEENLILDEIGDMLLDEGRKVGPVDPEERAAIYRDEIMPFLFEELESAVQSLTDSGTLQRLVKLHEASLARDAKEQLTIPTRLACFGGADELLAQLAEDKPDRMKTAVGLRFLLEFVAARRPTGSQPLSDSTVDRLLALSASIVNFGFESDLLFHELVDGQVSILPSGRVGRDLEAWSAAGRSFMEAFSVEHANVAESEFRQIWNRGEAEAPDVVVELDEAFRSETGIAFTSWIDFHVEAARIAQQFPGSVARMEREDLLERIVQETGLGESVDQMLDQLVLSPRSGFVDGMDWQEVVPWRFNRRYSYLRRPYLADDEQHIVFGARQCIAAAEYLLHLCTTGKYRADSPELKDWISKVQTDASDAFVRRVAEIFGDCFGPDNVRIEVNKVGGGRLGPDGNELGDIDVLAIDESSRRVWLVECKDWGGARTPGELAGEIENLVGSDKSAIAKHKKRVEWLSQNVEPLLMDLDLADRGEWTLDPLLVVSHSLMGPRLRETEFDVITARELDAYLLASTD